jgi:hypothetical protein
MQFVFEPENVKQRFGIAGVRLKRTIRFMGFLPGGCRMERTICWAVFALLVPSGVVRPQTHVAPRRPVKVIVVHRYDRSCFLPSVVPAPLLYPVPYATTQYSTPIFIPASPTYVLVGSASTIRPQLLFKDGTSYTVSDYWRADDQLHFITLEEGGTKSVPHSVPFNSLDVERTKEAASAQGFRFVIRDEPLDQWLEHRAQNEHRHNGRSREG